MAVAWRSASQQGVSRMGTMALGGLFLHTASPPSNGSMLELLFDVATGAQVRARAVVRNSMPGKGMGVKFVHMRSEDRSRLNQFLKVQLEAGNIQPDLPPEEPQTAAAVERETQDPGAIAVDVASIPKATTAPGGPATNSAATPEDLPKRVEHKKTASEGKPSAQGAQVPQEGKLKQDEGFVSLEELQRYLALSEKSNHYQLLGVPSDASNQQIKKGFYALARKFHPDRHMDRPEWVQPLQKLMGAITDAHKVLSDETKRGHYDRKLIHRQTEAEVTLEDCVKLAANAQRDENVEGAIFWMRKCVTIAPEVSRYHASLASSLAGAPHHRREAAEHFQKAIELDRWNTEAYLQFGEMYEAMKLPWRAEPLYSKILEFDPGHVAARQGLTRIRGKEKKKNASLGGIFSKKS